MPAGGPSVSHTEFGNTIPHSAYEFLYQFQIEIFYPVLCSMEFRWLKIGIQIGIRIEIDQTKIKQD